jgi:hypothetical protein
MAALATVNPTYLKSLITDNGNGVYTVDFYNGKTQTHDYVTVNSEMAMLPSNMYYPYEGGKNHLAFDWGGVSGAIWSEVMEKAYVEFRSQTGEKNAYSTIWGGFTNGLIALTGQTVTNYWTHGMDSAQLGSLVTTMHDAMASGNAVMMSDDHANVAMHLVGNHMYNILSVDAGKGTVTVDNPWNTNGYMPGAVTVFTAKVTDLAGAGCDFYVASGAYR